MLKLLVFARNPVDLIHVSQSINKVFKKKNRKKLFKCDKKNVLYKTRLFLTICSRDKLVGSHSKKK